MKQTVAAGHELNESTEIENRAHCASVDLTLFGNSDDGLDAVNSCLDRVGVGGTDLDLALAVDLVDRDVGTGLFLNALDDFATLADDGTDKLFVDGHAHDARHMRLVVGTRFGNGLVDEVEDVQASFLSLIKCLLKHLIGESVALDIHLSGCDTVLGTSHLEVHVAQMVFVAQDVAEHGVLHITLVGDESHSDTSHRFLEFHACVEQSHAASTHGGHRRRTVRLEDVTHHTHGVGEVLSGKHALQGTPCEVAVAYLTTAHTAGSFSLAG